ncbi:MAG TPA: hypothetical protein VFA74_20630 [Terriglobales bacterium]|nr:hypothetical protein [Terriglobales bacterium]
MTLRTPSGGSAMQGDEVTNEFTEGDVQKQALCPPPEVTERLSSIRPYGTIVHRTGNEAVFPHYR